METIFPPFIAFQGREYQEKLPTSFIFLKSTPWGNIEYKFENFNVYSISSQLFHRPNLTLIRFEIFADLHVFTDSV